MLTEIVIENYRCFERHMAPLRPLTVVVGRNNAGKSTLVEAFRLVSSVVNRYRALTFRDPPRWSNLPKRERGVSPSLRDMDFNFTSMFHRYGEPPSTVSARFDSGHAVRVHIAGEEDIHGVIFDGSGHPIRDRRGASLPRVSILPQVAPVSRDEPVRSPDYVRSRLLSPLTPLHFRNQLYLRQDMFASFRRLAEQSWPGLRIRRLEATPGGRHAEAHLSLLVQDGDFVAELGAMGHGLQMWLQVIWFLTLCHGHETVVLDEPDVYMHADLQRRLMRLVRGRHQQTIFATHSVEILSQVEPDEVLVLDRSQPTSRFAVSLPGVQRVIDDIGGVHNIQIARLWTARRFVLVEGDDLHILKQIHEKLCPDSADSIADIPNMSISGWGGWDHATSSGLLIRNASGTPITTYCILDRDYHTDEEIQRRLQEARSRRVQLHIWKRKEIENYLLVPAAIWRAVNRVSAGRRSPSEGEITDRITDIADSMREQTLDAFSGHHLAVHRQDGVAKANKIARDRLSAAWDTREGKLGIVAGKTVLSNLFQWLQASFGISLSKLRVAQELQPSEVPKEMKLVIAAIDQCDSFSQARKAS